MNDNEFINKELQIPERLLFMLNYLEHDTYITEQRNTEFQEIKTAAKFYEVIINNCIEKCLYKKCALKFSKEEVKVIRNGLGDIAWDMTVDNVLRDEVKDKIDKKFFSKIKKKAKGKLGENDKIWEILTRDSDFLVDERGKFRFEGCRHYLVAVKIFQSIKERDADIASILCNPIFFEKANLQIYQFLVDLVLGEEKNKEVKEENYRIIWKNLIRDEELGKNNRIQILFNILERAGHLENFAYLEEFIKVILQELSSKYYDDNVFDTIHSINLSYPGIKINDYLKEQYKKLQGDVAESEEYIDNMKRRLAYFLGKERCGIIPEMIEDLINPEIHVHVKYHIILAVIESYDLQDTESILTGYDKKIRECEDDWKEDCILYSDYIGLQAKRNSVKQGFGTDAQELQNRLYKELRNGKYWRRAHAAGALGRQGLLSSKNQLLEQLNKELSQIQAEKENLKAVSYIIEAVCELFYQKYQENTDSGRNHNEKRTCIGNLIDLIVSTLPQITPDKDRESIGMHLVAFATIAEGMKYLIEEVEEKRPDDIGKHIKAGKRNIKENCFAIVNSFIIVKNKYKDEIEDIGNKLESVREVLNQLEDRNSEENGSSHPAQDKTASAKHENGGMRIENNTSNGGQLIMGDYSNVTINMDANKKR